MLPIFLIQLLILCCTTSATAANDDEVVMNSGFSPQTSLMPSLTDLLTIERSVSIFYSYARETDFSKMFDDTAMNITVLAPTNKAVISLPQKPHQGPKENIEHMPKISQAKYDLVSKENVARWVGAHIIPRPVALDSQVETYETLLPQNTMTFRRSDESDSQMAWRNYELENDISIVQMKEASNGVLYLIDGTSLY